MSSRPKQQATSTVPIRDDSSTSGLGNLDAQQLAKTITDVVTVALKPSTDPPVDDLRDDDVDTITGLGLSNKYSLKSPEFDSIFTVLILPFAFNILRNAYAN